MAKRGRPQKHPKRERTRVNIPNPYPKRESNNTKFAYGIFRRYRDGVTVSYQYDGSTGARWNYVPWDKLPEDVKLFPEIAELDPSKKPVK